MKPMPLSGKRTTFKNPTPWPTPVDGGTLFEEIVTTIKRFVVLPDAAAETMALWVIHTYALDAAYVTPRLCFTGPEKECGKTTSLEVLAGLVARPLQAANVTPAVVFRAVDKHRPTLLIDEADTFLHGKEELRGILNSGHIRSGSVPRLERVGDSYELAFFSTFGPVAIALIGELPATLAARAVTIRLRRKLSNENVDPVRADRLAALETLRRKVARWVRDNLPALKAGDPDIPATLYNRAADNWRPLLAIADVVGGTWPARARAAALLLSGKRDEGVTTPRIQVLADLRELFEERKVDKLRSEEIVDYLVEQEDRPWSEWLETTAPARQLATLLAPFDIRPKTLRLGKETAKGYERMSFEDAWRRYLPAPGGSVVTEVVTDANRSGDSDADSIVTDVTDIEGESKQAGSPASAIPSLSTAAL